MCRPDIQRHPLVSSRRVVVEDLIGVGVRDQGRAVADRVRGVFAAFGSAVASPAGRTTGRTYRTPAWGDVGLVSRSGGKCSRRRTLTRLPRATGYRWPALAVCSPAPIFDGLFCVVPVNSRPRYHVRLAGRAGLLPGCSHSPSRGRPFEASGLTGQGYLSIQNPPNQDAVQVRRRGARPAC